MENKEFSIILGQQIKKARQEKNMTQSELASLMDIDAQNVSSYERGERCPSMFWMHRLYTALEITPSKFTEELYKAPLLSKEERRTFNNTPPSKEELARRAEEHAKKKSKTH